MSPGEKNFKLDQNRLIELQQVFFRVQPAAKRDLLTIMLIKQPDSYSEFIELLGKEYDKFVARA